MTEFYVDYFLFDVTALDDATEESETKADFSDMTLFKEHVNTPKYGTLEHNFFALDETCQEFPDENPEIAYYSSVQSGENGTFDEPPSVIINFSENHLSSGIGLYFLEEYPLELEISWFDLEGELLSKEKFYPKKLFCYCTHTERYGKIKIEFLKTIPTHNVKLQYIEYGLHVIWDNDIVKNAKINNEIDMSLDKIKTDTLNFEFVDEEGDFDATNSAGLYRTFQRKQYMLPYEIVDGNEISLGAYFMESVKSEKNICKISAVDFKGLLANTTFRDGDVYNGVPAGDIIDSIMLSAGITDYTVDNQTQNTLLYGTLKIQTCQSALREVLFACGSTISTANRTDVKIEKYVAQEISDITELLPLDRKFSTQIQEDKYVSDISVKFKTYKMKSEESEIVSGVYGAGTHTIELSQPAKNMRASYGTIANQMPYYVVLEVPQESEVTIFGKAYDETESAATASIEHIKAGEMRSSKSFSGTLLNYALAKNAADRILNYYQMQDIIQSKHLVDGEIVGNYTEVENPEDGYSRIFGVIESMSTDLAGGYISNTKLRGYMEHEV